MSVVIPTYGRADYLLLAIDSVLRQTRPAREVIVVDDGSPDDTGARVAPLVRDGRIRYVRRENGGMAVARNTGAALATGEYLLFLDDDDLLVPTALDWLVDELDRHPAAGFAYGDAVLFSGPTPPPIADAWSAPYDADRTEFLLFNQIGSAGQVLLRRSAFDALGGWRDRYPGVQDWDLWLRLLAAYPARGARRPAMAYRLHDDNMSRDVARMYRSSLGVARDHLAKLPAEQRVVLRRLTFIRLRRYHEPRLRGMFGTAIRRRHWRKAGAAAGAWCTAWAAEVASRAALRADLVRRGRWRLPPRHAIALPFPPVHR